MQHPDLKVLSAQDIADRLEHDRAELAGNIDGLRERLSAGALIEDAIDFARANMAPYARALDGAVRANPLAAVLAGVGIAWLAFGRRSAAQQPAMPLAGTRFEALSRWEDEGGPVAPLPVPDDAWPDNAWIAEADRLRDAASAALARIEVAARGRIGLAAETARDRADVLADLARSTRTAMLRGLETFSGEAQARMLATREQTYAARVAAVRQGTRLIEEKPVLAGAIGMAIGAVVASALPTSSTEDRLFGDERDRLMRQARAAIRTAAVAAPKAGHDADQPEARTG